MKVFFTFLVAPGFMASSAGAADVVTQEEMVSGVGSYFEGMNALTLVFVSLLVFAIAYRFYGVFIANKVLRLDANRVTPAVKYADGRFCGDYGFDCRLHDDAGRLFCH